MSAPARRTCADFVYAFTGGVVFGEPIELPGREHHPARPISLYGASKHTFEHCLEMCLTLYGLPYSILPMPLSRARVSIHCARRGSSKYLGQDARLGGDRHLRDGGQTRDFVFVEGVARANLLGTDLARAGGLFNSGTGVGSSIEQGLDHLRREIGYRLLPAYGPAKPGEARHSFVDCTHASGV